MRSLSLPRRRTVLSAAAVATAGAALARPAAATPALAAPAVGMPSDAAAAREVRDEFVHSWEGYKRAAWGYDEVRPVSGGRNDFFADGHTFGLSIVEALDTLWLMELDDEVARAADWIEQEFDPTQDADVQVFETVIRLVGGLVSGYLCTGRRPLLDRCRELADRLLPAFTRSPTGMPYRYVNLRTGAVSGGTSPLAEIGSNILEFGMLSQLTGNQKYWDAAKRAMRAVFDRRSALGLLGTSLNIETGRWTDTTSCAPNPPVDSYYEYLWAGAELFGDGELRDWYKLLTGAVLRYQLEHRGGYAWYKQVDYATGRTTGRGASELGSFYPGLLGKGGDMDAAVDYYNTWTMILDNNPVVPEAIDYGNATVRSARNDLRPEYVNSSFDLWMLTGDRQYKETAYGYFAGLRDQLRVPGGYTVAEDVTTAPLRRGDLTPGYWFAENPKYLYLMFAAAPRFDYRSGLLSTEGKLMRGAVR
ncbi:glycoside hydrolase family 47 protein [Streptomyces sp. NRRL B-24484]|uniref:glycoside hydrolase family 47 protein n=1 Tax=Streptomyces sp. NRRL B-24484 TaxID=1463833 RepID=UPI0004C10051|nr:glycoside hydrolase family 47 protein [Streptomyces sp. NRRL B-24484]